MAKYKFTLDDLLDVLKEAKAVVDKANALESHIGDLVRQKGTLQHECAALQVQRTTEAQKIQDEHTRLAQTLSKQREDYNAKSTYHYEQAMGAVRELEATAKRLQENHVNAVAQHKTDMAVMQEEATQLSAQLVKMEAGIKKAKDQAAKLVAV